MQQIADWLKSSACPSTPSALPKTELMSLVLRYLTDQDLKDRRPCSAIAERCCRDRQAYERARPTATMTPPATLPSSRRAPIPAAAAAADSAAAEAAGERRHVTVMFCDLVDSTGIAASSMPRNGAT